METKNWNCKNCNEEVDETFELCWNCSADRHGNLDVNSKTKFEEIKKEVRIYRDEGKRVMVNPFHIVGAGRSLKSIVYNVIALIACQTMGGFLCLSSRDKGTILWTAILFGLLSLLCLVFVLLNLYTAGNHLEDSVKNN